jgi:hypothetical protein
MVISPTKQELAKEFNEAAILYFTPGTSMDPVLPKLRSKGIFIAELMW